MTCRVPQEPSVGVTGRTAIFSCGEASSFVSSEGGSGHAEVPGGVGVPRLGSLAGLAEVCQQVVPGGVHERDECCGRCVLREVEVVVDAVEHLVLDGGAG
jgi:hypothetical protein